VKTSKEPTAAAGLAASSSPVLHVGAPNVGDRSLFLDYAAQILDRGWLTNNGPLVQEFEQRVAAYAGVKHCVATCNGTVALEIAIRAMGLKGEVILPSYTFIATAHAVQSQNLTPVFADIDPATHQLDPESVARCITPETSAILGVHLWGQACPVQPLQALAARHGLQLFFDAAHAFGCSSGGEMIGGFGRAEVFSFHATKFFNSFEGGAIVTNDDDLAEAARLIRNFGFSGLDQVVHLGTNGKMVEICAAMGLTNFASIDSFIAGNRRNYLAYRAALAGVAGINVLPYNEAERTNYQYIVLEVGPESAATRDEIVDALRAANILARRYFWPGCHRMQPYATLYPDTADRLPNTALVASRVIVLPTGMSVTVEHIDAIAERIRRLATGA
jgi:dTDP-4-amino-4,6-dideoxygalactose transaminase